MKKLSLFCILSIAIVSFWHLFTIRLSGERWKYIINSDGAGYYAYLPAAFIYHDLNYGFAEENSPLYKKYSAIDIRLFGNKNTDGKRIDKYFIGTAVLQSPFFFTARLFSGKADGYSYAFQFAIALAGIFYLLAGLFFIRKLLQKMNFSEAVTGLVLLTLFFGTNLYYYALEEPSMSHVYSFALVAVFLFCLQQLRENNSGRYFFFSCITFALLVLVRPTNGIILLVLPFFFSLEEFKTYAGKILQNKKTLAVSAFISCALIFLQALTWKISGGYWLEDSYNGEHFAFLHPHFFQTLFSWRKGLFIYTPVLLMSIAGIFFIPSRTKKTGLLLFLLINTWIISSWESWWYGGSFGMRPFIDCYPVFAIGLAFVYRSAGKLPVKIAIGTTAAFFVFLNLFQVMQYHSAILPYDLMTWTKYKKIFLESDPVFTGIFPPEKENSNTIPPGRKCIFTLKRNFDNDTFPNKAGIVTDELYSSGNAAVRVDYITKISGDLFFPLKNIIRSRHCFLRVKAKIRMMEDVTNTKMVIAFKDKKKTYSWNGFYLVHRISSTGNWEDYTIALPVPVLVSDDEVASVYLVKDDDKTVYMDDLEVSLWE